MPGFLDSKCVVGNVRIRLHFRIDGNDDLIGCVSLKLIELLVELIRVGLRNDVGVIVKIPVWNRRNDLRCPGGCLQKSTDQQEREE